MIVLYDSSETSFTTMGLGSLPDAISCSVKEELNGSFELEMEYPITGLHYSEIQLRRIIFAKSNPYSDPQAFRIYSITKPLNGVVTINAEHISYDLSGYPVSSLEADSAIGAMSMIPSSIPLYGTGINDLFTFWTDISSSGNSGETKVLSVTTPVSVRALLGGDNNSILTTFGGEYEFDNFDVKLHSHRGYDRGVTILYGKNLTDVEQEENCNAVYTGIYPFTYSEEEGLTELTSKYVYAEGSFGFIRILPVDFSSYWDSAPLESTLLAAAQQYIAENNIGVPQVSLKVSFVDLSKSNETDNAKLLESVYLGDTVTVKFEKLGIDAKSKCISTNYDVLLDRYIDVELGSPKTDIGDVILDQGKKATESLKEVLGGDIPTRSFVQEAAMNAAKLLSGGLGGYVVLHSSTGGNEPDELLIMDSPNINQAQKIWRFNRNGLGYFDQGYNDPSVNIALTNDGKINASMITAGELDGQYIKANTLSINKINFTDPNDNVVGSIRSAYGALSLSASSGTSGTPSVPATPDTEEERLVPYEWYTVSLIADTGGLKYWRDTTRSGTGSYRVLYTGFFEDHTDNNGCVWYKSLPEHEDENYVFASIILEFNSVSSEDIVIRCINNGEKSFDYGIISNFDMSIPVAYYQFRENSSNAYYPSSDIVDRVYYTFVDADPSTNYVDITIHKPAGAGHTLQIVYQQDTSNYDNYFMFTLMHTVTVTVPGTPEVPAIPGTPGSISLNVTRPDTGTVELSKVGIDLFGVVTFHDLENDYGTTRINGGIIDTQYLKLNEVRYMDSDGYWYPIASGKIYDGITTRTYFGPRNVTNKSVHETFLFGTDIYFLRIGMTSNNDPSNMSDALIISPSNHAIHPSGSSSWNIGTVHHYFNSLYIDRIYLGVGASNDNYLWNSNGRLMWGGTGV